MRMDPAAVNEAIGVLCTALGEEWWRNSASEFVQGGFVPSHRHPLGVILHVAGENQVAEALELARYIAFFAQSPNLGLALDNLKATPQYASTLLQLAFAYRLGRSGALDLSFEPPAQAGRFGDIAFSHAAFRYHVECYSQVLADEVTTECELLLKQSLNVVKDMETPFSIAIQLHVMPSAEVRRSIVGLIGDIAARINKDANTQSPGALVRELSRKSSATVSVCQSLESEGAQGEKPMLVRHPEFPRQSDDYISMAQVGLARKSDIRRVQSTRITVARRSVVALWFPPQEEEQANLLKDLEDPLRQLGKKIEKKVVQTRGDESTRGLMIAQRGCPPRWRGHRLNKFVSSGIASWERMSASTECFWFSVSGETH